MPSYLLRLESNPLSGPQSRKEFKELHYEESTRAIHTGIWYGLHVKHPAWCGRKTFRTTRNTLL
jgi:hypothetical protein